MEPIASSRSSWAAKYVPLAVVGVLAADVVRVEGQEGLVRRHTRRAAVEELHHEIELLWVSVSVIFNTSGSAPRVTPDKPPLAYSHDWSILTWAHVLSTAFNAVITNRLMDTRRTPDQIIVMVLI